MVASDVLDTPGAQLQFASQVGCVVGVLLGCGGVPTAALVSPQQLKFDGVGRGIDGQDPLCQSDRPSASAAL